MLCCVSVVVYYTFFVPLKIGICVFFLGALEFGWEIELVR